MGVVTLLSGQPKEGVSVEARAESKGFYEETVTDSTGFYRLRGLLPDTTYVIKVAKKVAYGGSMIERASPQSMTVQVGTLNIFIFLSCLVIVRNTSCSSKFYLMSVLEGIVV